MANYHKRDPRSESYLKLQLLLVAGNVAIALMAALLLILYCDVLSRIFGVPVLRHNGGTELVFILSAVMFFLIGWVVSHLLSRVTSTRPDR
jgi:hypothetical protein